MLRSIPRYAFVALLLLLPLMGTHAQVPAKALVADLTVVKILPNSRPLTTSTSTGRPVTTPPLTSLTGTGAKTTATGQSTTNRTAPPLTNSATAPPMKSRANAGQRSILGWPVVFSVISITVTVIMIALAVLLFVVWRRSRRLASRYDQLRFINERAQQAGLLDSTQASASNLPSEPAAIPEKLVSLCVTGNCVLFAGPGLGAQAGLPTRQEAVARLVQSATIPAPLRKELGDAINAGQLSFVTEVLAAKVPRHLLLRELQFLYLGEPDLSPAHKALQKISFAAAITASWDVALEAVFSGRDPIVLSSDEDVLKEMPKHNDFFIAKLNGDLENPASVVFSSTEARVTMMDRPGLSKFIAAEAFSRPILFIGMPISGIEEFFENFRIRRSSLPAYALMPYAPYWDAQCERLDLSYGVKLIGYPPTAGHPEVAAFLSELADRVQKAKPRKLRDQVAPQLNRIRLTNIGMFDNLDLDLNAGWNVIIGNNGSGKSTILRAIALGLCGEDAEAARAGQRLLKQRKTSGKIELFVGEVVYETTLRRDREGRRVIIRGSPTPLQKRDWVVLGFPPLRGISLRNPPGPSRGGSPDPEVEDLIPVITGGFDTRLDSIKQWLVNVDVNSSGSSSVPKEVAARNQRLRQSFFDLLNKLIPGQSIRYSRVDRTTWQAFVITDDGEVPIDDVSQGMGSIFGWAGTLLQRLYEIHPDSDKPAHAPALVLIDEIDAHLHPEWQQRLVGVIREEFKNLQVVATTHSPLIVGSMKQNELLVADRDPVERGTVTVTHSLINPAGLRTDQVLTTPLFGLQSTRSPEVVRKINRYAFLFGKLDPNEEEKKELEELKVALSGMLVHGETPSEREAERAATQATKATSDEIIAIASASTPEMKEMLRKELTDARR